jgi:hypothetical protein
LPNQSPFLLNYFVVNVIGNLAEHMSAIIHGDRKFVNWLAITSQIIYNNAGKSFKIKSDNTG